MDKLERWVVWQGSAYNTVIGGVSENLKSIKEITDSLNEVIQYMNRTSKGAFKGTVFHGIGYRESTTFELA